MKKLLSRGTIPKKHLILFMTVFMVHRALFDCVFFKWLNN